MQKKILCVDDDPIIIEMLTTRLEASGYEVIGAEDGVEGLEKVLSHQPDLILLDIMMPRMDGSELLQRLKDEGLTKKIPIIVLTAKASMREFYLVQGASELMVKPFKSHDLLAEIDRQLQK